MSSTQLFELTPAEAMFAPFNDPAIAEQLPFRLEPGTAVGLKRVFGWDGTKLSWETAPGGTVAARLELPLDGLPGRFDQFVFCQVVPRHVSASFEARRAGQWTPLGAAVTGVGGRDEITRAMGARPIEAVRVTFSALGTDPVLISLQWWGVAQAALVAELAAARPRYDGRWEGLLLPPETWPEVKLARGLLFSAADLPALRLKRTAPYWEASWQLLEERARQFLTRRPEDDIGDYLPWTDTRYIRAREAGRESYFSEPLVLGFVGLVNGDRAMGFHALRYLMCLVHTTSWAQSAESRARGSVWDQRCFMEEMAATAAALLLDWYDFALTPRARALAQQALWDKGTERRLKFVLAHSHPNPVRSAGRGFMFQYAGGHAELPASGRHIIISDRTLLLYSSAFFRFHRDSNNLSLPALFFDFQGFDGFRRGGCFAI